MENILYNYSDIISTYAMIAVVLLGVTIVFGLIKRLFKFVVIVLILAILSGYMGFSAATFDGVKQQAKPVVNEITNIGL